MLLFRRIVAAALVICLGVSSAYGQKNDSDAPMQQSVGAAFRNCDGFGGASRGGDGVTQPHRGVDVVARIIPPFEHSIAYCDRALSVLEDEFPRFWVRRTTLLQSRSIYRLIEGDIDGALQDLSVADASAPDANDGAYRRALQINSMLIRAFALQLRGDEATANELVSEAVSRRPYNRGVAAAALMILGFDSPHPTATAARVQLDRLGAHTRAERDLFEFFALMLDPESDEQRFRGGGSDLYFNRLSGPYVGGNNPRALQDDCGDQASGLLPATNDLAGVCYFSMNQTPAVVEDRVLLRAARLSLDRTQPYFAIESRRDTAHWASSPYSRQRFLIGYEATLTIEFHANPCARCFAAAEVVEHFE